MTGWRRRDFLAASAAVAAAPASSVQISLCLRGRGAEGDPVFTESALDPRRAAAVLVDAWTAHSCSGFTAAARPFLPAINRTLAAARQLGMTIVFGSSGDDLKRWEGKPQRENVLRLPAVELPPSNGFLKGHGSNGPFGSPCMCTVTETAENGDPVFHCRKIEHNLNQHPDIEVFPQDLFIAAGHYNPGVKSAIRSWGEPAQRELWNIVRSRGITRLVYLGFATNMCVINREFAMIQMKRLGLETMLVRDVTLSMTYDGYNPMTRALDARFTPRVSTRYAVEYIEDRIGPSIESAQLIEAARTRRAS